MSFENWTDKRDMANSVRFSIARTTWAALGVIFMLGGVSHADSGITYHGRLLRSNDTPVNSATTEFRIQIRTPGSEDCLLWEEYQTKNLSASNGTFTISIAKNSDPSMTTANILPFSIERVFSNRTNFTGLTCGSGSTYNPATMDGRELQVYFREVNTDPWEALPVVNINYVPFSLNSQQLAGFSASEFLKIDPASTYTTLTAANVDTLEDLIAGTNTQYLRPATTFAGDITGTYSATVVERIRGTNVVATAPTSGQVLKFNGTNWAPAADDTGSSPGDASYAAKGIVQINTDQTTSGLYINSGVLALPNVITAGGPIGGVSTIPVITYDQKGRLTAVTTATVDDTTKLPLAGGTMTGAINMGTQNITNATSVAATNFSGRNLVLNDNDTNTVTIRTPSDISANYILELPADDGTSGQVLTTDGSGVLSWASGASGDITDVVAGAGLVTGGSSGSVTLDVAAGTGIVVGANDVAVDAGLGANKVPMVGGTALGANGVVVANGTATALTSLNCTLNQVIKFDASGFATCGADSDTGASTGFAQNGNSFTANAVLGTNDNFSLAFETNGTTRMTLDTSGNVGISNVAPGAKLEIGTAGSSLGTMRLAGSTSGYVQIQPSAAAGSWTMTLPDNDGTSGQVLTTDGAGVLSWTTAASSESTTVANVGTGAGVYKDMTSAQINLKTILGTSNQVVVTSNTDDITLSLPQSIHTGASPTFTGMTLSSLSTSGVVKNNASGVLSTGTVNLASEVSGVLPVANGGTNSSTALNNNRIMVSSGGAIVEAGALTNGQLLIGSTGAAPVAAALTGGTGITVTNGAGSISLASTLGTSVDLASEVTGTLPVGNGGTGTTSYAANAVIVSNGTGSALSALNCTNGQVIKFDASGYAGCGADSGGATASGTAGHVQFSDGSGGLSSDSSQLFWDSTNNRLGIGTATPSVALDVSGDFNVQGGFINVNKSSGDTYTGSGASTYPSSTIMLGNNLSGTGQSSIMSFRVRNSGATDQYAHIGAVADPAYPAIVFGQQSGAAAYTERMRIAPGGNVGISNTNPGAKLEIGTAGSSLGTMRLAGNTSGYVQIQPSAAAGSYTLTLPTDDGTSGQVLSSDGSGVLSWVSVPSNGGTFLAADGSAASPSYSFSNDTDSGFFSVGSNQIGVSAGNNVVATFNNASINFLEELSSHVGSATNAGVNFSGDTNTGIFSPGADTFAITTAGSERLRIDSSGNVAIGTTTTSEKLAIAGANQFMSASGAIAKIQSTDAQNADIGGSLGFGGQDGIIANRNFAIIGGFKENGTSANTAGYFAIGTRPNGLDVAERMRITSAGNVGIGTTSPGALLQLGTAGTSLGTMRLTGNTSGYVQIQPSAAAGSWTMTLPDNDGTSGQVLQTDGAGVLSWATPASSESTTVANVGTGAGIYRDMTSAQINLKSILGTSNQVTVTSNANDLTLSLPQSIHTGASPTFTGMTLSSLSTSGVVKNNASGVLSTGTVNLASEVSGVLPVANGGTNSSTALNNNRIMVSSGGAIVEAGALTNGQLLIGSTGAAPVAAALTAGSGINVSNGAGSISIASTLGTSVDLTSEVTGTLPVGNGGTGATSFASNAVILSNGTGSALSALNCTLNQVIKFDASGYAGCGADDNTSSPALSAISAATSTPTALSNSTFSQTWNWALTGASADAFTFGESAASTGGSGDQSILKAATVASSTAIPLMVTNLGNGISFRVNDATGDTDTTPFVVDASGNVGIGNTAPGAMFQIGTAGTSLGTMRLTGSTSGYVQIQPLAAAGSYTLTLPPDDGTSGQVLTTNGTGTLSWATAGSGNVSNGGNSFAGAMTIGTNDNNNLNLEINNTTVATFSNSLGPQAALIGGTSVGWKSFAVGDGSTTNGAMSMALGAEITANAMYQFTAGSNNITVGTEDSGTWVATDPLFVIGNGTAWNALSNALMVFKNGRSLFRGGTTVAIPSGNASMTVMGSTTDSTAASFNATDSAGTSRFFVRNDGSTGVGTTSPSARLDVTDTGTTTSAIIVPRAGNFTGTNVNGMIRYNTTSTLFEFRQNGAWVNYTTVSDGRLKTNIEPVVDGLNLVNQLSPVYYDWDRSNPKATSFEQKHQIGFIAQDVEKVLPEVVNKGEDGYRSLEYGKMVSVVVAAVQELYRKLIKSEARQAQEISGLKREIASVKAENEELKKQNESIKAWICKQDPKAALCH